MKCQFLTFLSGFPKVLMSKLRSSNINCLELCLNQSALADNLGNLMHFLSQSKLRNCSQKYSNFRDLCHYELNNTTGVTFKTVVSCNSYFLALSKNIFTFQKYFRMTNELRKFVWELGRKYWVHPQNRFCPYISLRILFQLIFVNFVGKPYKHF